MICGVQTLSQTSILCCLTSTIGSRRPPMLQGQAVSFGTPRILCSNSSPNVPLTPDKLGNSAPMTGGAFDFNTLSLTDGDLISSSKKVTLLRHGLSSWNEESRIQVLQTLRHLIKPKKREKKGSSNTSVLTETGIRQAERCQRALANIQFDKCFSSPISRARSTAKIVWQGREEPLVFIDSLKEAHLFYLEGMKNVDAKQIYPKEYTTWREDPASFEVNGIYPLREVWATSSEAWKEILLTPGEHFLVVTHKSILRALVCTALGLGPDRFRAIDVNNGGITVFKFNQRGEAMLQSLNMTSHMYSDHVYKY